MGGLVEQVRRHRTRPRLEQQQAKWFLVAIAGQSAYIVTIIAGFEPGSVTFLVIDNLATMLSPVTILVAISRYRLYEIDRIISRTLGYCPGRGDAGRRRLRRRCGRDVVAADAGTSPGS